MFEHGEFLRIVRVFRKFQLIVSYDLRHHSAIASKVCLKLVKPAIELRYFILYKTKLLLFDMDISQYEIQKIYSAQVEPVYSLKRSCLA